MKRWVLFLIAIALFFATPCVYAQQTYPLGIGNLALKVDYLRFTDGKMDDLDLANALYVGLEGYVSVLDTNLYLGMESGWAGSSNDSTFYLGRFQYGSDMDVTYVPIELNVKYVFPIHPLWNFDIGAGISANYFDISWDVGPYSLGDDDWVFGGQLFADLNFKMCQWFGGVNVKYQLTDDLSLGRVVQIDGREIDFGGGDVSASNFRVGAQFGYMF